MSNKPMAVPRKVKGRRFLQFAELMLRSPSSQKTNVYDVMSEGTMWEGLAGDLAEETCSFSP